MQGGRLARDGADHDAPAREGRGPRFERGRLRERPRDARRVSRARGVAPRDGDDVLHVDRSRPVPRAHARGVRRRVPGADELHPSVAVAERRDASTSIIGGIVIGGRRGGGDARRPRRVRRAGTTPDGQRRAVFLWQNPDVARRARVRASELPRARARRGRASRGAQKAPGAGDVRGRDEARPAHTGPHTTPSAWWNADP